MAPGEPRRRYRKLGEDIFLKLAEMAGAPLAVVSMYHFKLSSKRTLTALTKNGLFIHTATS